MLLVLKQKNVGQVGVKLEFVFKEFGVNIVDFNFLFLLIIWKSMWKKGCFAHLFTE